MIHIYIRIYIYTYSTFLHILHITVSRIEHIQVNITTDVISAQLLRISVRASRSEDGLGLGRN